MTTTASPTPATSRGGFLRQGYPRSLALGAAFSIAWSPCIGPILGAVLTLAATSGTVGQGPQTRTTEPGSAAAPVPSQTQVAPATRPPHTAPEGSR